MNKLKKVLAAVVEASSRPAESWRFLRQAVRELHVVLQGVTSIVADFEARLDRLEKAATRAPQPGPRPKAKKPRRTTAAKAPQAAPKKTARKKTARKRSSKAR
ncbi:hypothetical protein [Solimonas terrae]|uniref:Uncharacterized protein n=1 Tax=Solimonas terrae TaxID=1396819 RepID=A0A6M2BMR4_9GAMM|nr:hypothetical protein [Solimonas terrae]NGY03387.1 hypothetical protein [Solimonas terrae]